MNYEETLEYIHSLHKFGIKPGLDNIKKLLMLLGNPQNNNNFVHVAGTNGKGSVSTYLSNIFIADGKKTGLFISPYVVDFKERIQINGQYISENSLCLITKEVKEAAQKLYTMDKTVITEFEFITAAAFLYFSKEKCDIVVLETGLGGRLDSTNVIKKPLASIITKIDFDHTAVLGDTIEKIAYEKAGIIKSNSIVITTDKQDKKALEVIKNTALSVNSEFVCVDSKDAKNIICTEFNTQFEYKNIKLISEMPGMHQVENMSLAVQTALKLKIGEQSIKSGILRTSFPARLEMISKSPLVLLDGAHNPNGAGVLADYLKSNKISPVAVMGMMKDKDCFGVAKLIAPLCSAVLTVTVNSNQRAISAEELANIAAEFCNKVIPFSNYNDALKEAEEISNILSVPILVCGSLYLASDIRPILLNKFK